MELLKTSDGVCNNRVVLTFYQSTSVIRIQGAGYALWINKVLPKLATKVMETLSQNGLTSQQNNASQDTETNLASPCHPRTFTVVSPHLTASTPRHSSTLTSASPHPTALTPCRPSTLTSAPTIPCHPSTLTSSSSTTPLRSSNKMLYDRISEMKAEIQTLHERVTEKEVDIKLLCNRVNEINVIKFEAESDRKLLAFSSLNHRKDSHDSKVDTVNNAISQICDENGWTFIDNAAIKKDKLADDVHPNARGMSFLAQNYQDFLRCIHPNLFPRTIYPKWVTCLMT